ncbi:MAG: hypothetical protein A2064_03795 [Spirochaetes bacterium GWB1_66_5]|nr:MAG: hypothetical protein A2064_03795 [Spirochaetes bacterium GWB1_66_5]
MEHGLSRLPVSFGDFLQQGDYRLHSRFSRALNYANEEHLVSLVTPEVGSGPTNIVLSDISWIDASEIEVAADLVRIGGRAVALPPERRYHSGLDFAVAEVHRSVQHLAVFSKVLLESSPPLSLVFLLDETRKNIFSSPFDRQLAARVSEAWNHLVRLDVSKGVSRMLGTGYGLTPSGDDFVAGWISGLHLMAGLFHRPAAEEMGLIRLQLTGGSPISRNLFWCSLHGRYVERVRDLLQAIGSGPHGEVERCARDVLGIGETSGADFSTGLVACLSLHGVLG